MYERQKRTCHTRPSREMLKFTDRTKVGCINLFDMSKRLNVLPRAQVLSTTSKFHAVDVLCLSPFCLGSVYDLKISHGGRVMPFTFLPRYCLRPQNFMRWTCYASFTFLKILLRPPLHPKVLGVVRPIVTNLKAWSHACRLVPHRPTHEKRMPFNDLKTNDVDKGEK